VVKYAIRNGSPCEILSVQSLADDMEVCLLPHLLVGENTKLDMSSADYLLLKNKHELICYLHFLCNISVSVLLLHA